MNFVSGVRNVLGTAGTMAAMVNAAANPSAAQPPAPTPTKIQAPAPDLLPAPLPADQLPVAPDFGPRGFGGASAQPPAPAKDETLTPDALKRDMGGAIMPPSARAQVSVPQVAPLAAPVALTDVQMLESAQNAVMSKLKELANILGVDIPRGTPASVGLAKTLGKVRELTGSDQRMVPQLDHSGINDDGALLAAIYGMQSMLGFQSPTTRIDVIPADATPVSYATLRAEGLWGAHAEIQKIIDVAKQRYSADSLAIPPAPTPDGEWQTIPSKPAIPKATFRVPGAALPRNHTPRSTPLGRQNVANLNNPVAPQLTARASR